jgi:hypothetical protein
MTNFHQTHRRINPHGLAGGLLAAAAMLPLAAPGQPAAGAPTAPPDGRKKPAWLTEASVGIKESYDDNVYLSGVAPVAAIIPNGGVAAQKNHSSWVSTVSPRVGFNLAPLLGDQSLLQSLLLSYAGDYVIYEDANTESHYDHRLGTEIKGRVCDFSFKIANTATVIQGSTLGVSFPSGLSAFNTAILRERREQEQERNNILLLYDQEKWFVRAVSSLLFYNLDTAPLPGSDYKGYQNYSSRYDVNGGLDFGWKVAPKLAVTLGCRDGAQYQQQFPLAVDKYGQSGSSDYQRVLPGLEGQPLSWLDVKLQGGPDFRRYGGNAPVNNDSQTTYYGEAVVTATFSPQDTLSVNYKQWQWVSSIGEVPYFDSNYDLNYKHRFNDKLTGSLGARLQESDYTSANALSGPADAPDSITKLRKDLLYTFSAGVQYAVTPHLSTQLGYALDLGRNAQSGISDAARVFNHQLVSLGVLFAF